jgi:hypothetical protein
MISFSGSSMTVINFDDEAAVGGVLYLSKILWCLVYGDWLSIVGFTVIDYRFYASSWKVRDDSSFEQVKLRSKLSKLLKSNP